MSEDLNDPDRRIKRPHTTYFTQSKINQNYHGDYTLVCGLDQRQTFHTAVHRNLDPKPEDLQRGFHKIFYVLHGVSKEVVDRFDVHNIDEPLELFDFERYKTRLVQTVFLDDFLEDD